MLRIGFTLRSCTIRAMVSGGTPMASISAGLTELMSKGPARSPHGEAIAQAAAGIQTPFGVGDEVSIEEFGSHAAHQQ